MKKLFYILCFFILFEIFCRYVIGLGNPIILKRHPSIEYELVPNQKVNRFHRQIKINSEGMRSDDLKIIKDPKDIRVLIFGDSIIWGGSLISQNNLGTELLREKKFNNRSLEIANISAGSWGPGNWLAFINERGLYDADIVILVISSHDWNDSPDFLYRNFIEKKPFTATNEFFMRYLFPKINTSFQNLKSLYRRNPNPLNKNISAKEIGNIKGKGLDDLSEFIDFVKESKAKLAIVQFWDKEEFIYETPKKGNLLIKKVIKEKNIPNIQSVDNFKKCSNNHKDLFTDSIHPFTKLGQKCLSETIFDAIKLTNDIPQKY